MVTLSAQLETEAAQIKNDGTTPEERQKIFSDYLSAYGLERTRVDDLLNECCEELSIKKFYTAGDDEVASWFIPPKCTAQEAAGRIHGDLEKYFIACHISKVADWVKAGGKEDKVDWKKFGKDYQMQENDVMVVFHSSR